MRIITIKNGNLISPVNGYHGDKKDILIRDGKISKIADHIETRGVEIDALGCMVTPGFIDIHTHCYPRAFLGMEPDTLGIARGATTILDAGSTGPDTYEDFRKQWISKSHTKVYTLLNLSRKGLMERQELDCLDKIDVDGAERLAEKYPDNIVGFKTRASASVVGDMGLLPIRLAAETAHRIGRPLMVHVGNQPPMLSEVLELMDENDIITHAYHGKPGGILTPDGHIIEAALRARNRGVKFDIGHGSASFSFQVYKQAVSEDFDCDMISTDLHIENYNGPVHNLPAVVSKLIHCGEKLEDAIAKCTSVPALHFGVQEVGQLTEGMLSDINIMSFIPCCEKVEDAMGNKLQLRHKLMLKKTIYSKGRESGVFEHIIEG